MQIRRLITALALLAVATPAAAQNQSVNSVKPLYDTVKGWIIASAEMVPEADYSFQPTPEVRNFGQLVGHVANASYMFCSGALGSQSPSQQNAEELTSKAQLVEAVKAAFAYCDEAYAMTDSKAMESVDFFNQTNTRLWVLNFNVAHDFEHYVNIVTYMRMKGLVPPSTGG
jgi:uncharacterized damage-inducible protein DinB